MSESFTIKIYSLELWADLQSLADDGILTKSVKLGALGSGF